MPSQTPDTNNNPEASERSVISPDDMLIKRETRTDAVLESQHHEQTARVTRLEGNEKVVIPLAAETFTVEKQETVTGVVRIHKTVTEHQEVINTPTFSESVDVERVPRGEWIDAVPSVRYEGQTMIIPVVEEVIVVEKRLRLREELHVTKRRTEDSTPQTVTLRREEVTIDREQVDQ
jgi:uncharacterized protein (TIGR02271 family)